MILKSTVIICVVFILILKKKYQARWCKIQMRSLIKYVTLKMYRLNMSKNIMFSMIDFVNGMMVMHRKKLWKGYFQMNKINEKKYLSLFYHPINGGTSK